LSTDDKLLVTKPNKTCENWSNNQQEGSVNYNDHIIRDPQICGGEPVIRGTRVLLRTILASLAEGCSDSEILGSFPTMTSDDLRAVIVFAATSAEEDLPLPGVPDLNAYLAR
jgi:uncharacterized protein (DUF433 family)